MYLVFENTSKVVSNFRITNTDIISTEFLVKIEVPNAQNAMKFQNHIEDALYDSLANLRFRQMHLQKMVKTQSLKGEIEYTLDIIPPQLLHDFNNLQWKNNKGKRQLMFIISERIIKHHPLEIIVQFAPHMINTLPNLKNLLGLVDSIATELPLEIDKLLKKQQ